MKGEKLYQSVADQLTELINDGVFPPGTRLPGERDLAERFGVSRVTIREAEIVLQALGRIKIKRGSGAYVLDQATKEEGRFPDVGAFELTEARLLFESESAALAARNISEEALERLEAFVKTMSDNDPDDYEASQLADRDFHLTIAAASGNEAVRHVVETLWRMQQELASVREVHESVCSRESAADRGAEHAPILNALQNGDSAAARAAMREHFRRLLAFMLDATEERALEELRKKASESRERYLTNTNL